MQPLRLHPDRLFPADPGQRAIARRLYDAVKALPIVSPHGHTDPQWFADNEPFSDPASLLIQPDHYVFRMLYSQGVKLEDLGIPARDGSTVERDPRKIWRCFAEHYHLFRGTPSRLWLDFVFADVFGMEVRLEAGSADLYYDRIDMLLRDPAFRPRALFERFYPTPAAAQTVPGGKSIACSSPAAIAWDASFAQMADPSGRAVAGVHGQALAEAG